LGWHHHKGFGIFFHDDVDLIQAARFCSRFPMGKVHPYKNTGPFLSVGRAVVLWIVIFVDTSLSVLGALFTCILSYMFVLQFMLRGAKLSTKSADTILVSISRFFTARRVLADIPCHIYTLSRIHLSLLAGRCHFPMGKIHPYKNTGPALDQAVLNEWGFTATVRVSVPLVWVNSVPVWADHGTADVGHPFIARHFLKHGFADHTHT
jgi:hypothetical protein